MSNHLTPSIKKFATFQDAIKAAIAIPDMHVASVLRQTSEWAGGTHQDEQSYSDAIRLAQTGWQRGKTLLDSNADLLSIDAKVYKLELYYDVVGDGGWDMGRVLDGAPECCMSKQESTQLATSAHGRILKVTVNMFVSCMVPTSVIILRGIAAISLVDALEQAGYRVELEAVMFARNQYDDNRNYATHVVLKHADEVMQTDQIIYALAHPSFTRRFLFALSATHGPQGIRMAKTDNGFPVYSKDEKEYFSNSDIHLPALSGYESQWSSQESAMTWIYNYLKEFGISLIE